MYAMAQDKEALGWFDLPGEIRNTIVSGSTGKGMTEAHFLYFQRVITCDIFTPRVPFLTNLYFLAVPGLADCPKQPK